MSGDSDEHVLLAVSVPIEVLDVVAERTVDLLLERMAAPREAGSPWLDVSSAMSYLGFSRNKLYKLTAARAIPFHKKRDGQGLLFHRDELDRWLEREYPSTGCTA